MATRATRKRSKEFPSQPEYLRPLRIVPLRSAPRLPSVTAPQLTYRGGPLLTSVQVCSIFWGAAWQESENAALIEHMDNFFDFILSSKLMDQLAEYSVEGQPIGHGARTKTLNFTSSEPGKSVADGQIQTMLQHGIVAGTFPVSTASSLYFVFLPPGTQVEQAGSKSCQVFCGYHEATAEDAFYAVMPFPGCSGCEGGLAIPDALTSICSHELCEAITDPIPGTGWYDDSNGEIGDICAWKTKTLGGYLVQLEWSNSADACV